MALLAHYTIPLDPRTKKNHMMIAGTGARCPKCGKRSRQYVRQGKANSVFTFEAAKFLHPKPQEPIHGPVQLVYHCYMKTRRRVDDLNIYASLDDLLVSNGILTDDNICVIRSRDGSFVDWDKDNPRSEIYIYEKEDTDGERTEDVHGR